MLRHVFTNASEQTTINSALTSKGEPFLLPVTIQEENPIPLKAFVDSGAMGNFIHPRIVTQFSLPTSRRPKKLRLQTVTGKTFAKVELQVTTYLTTQHGHSERITLDMAPIGQHDLILGLPWLALHGVQLDWKSNNIMGWSPSCKNSCFFQPDPALLVQKLSPTTQIPTRATPGSVGYDLHATKEITIPSGGRTLVGTGIAIKTPAGTYGRIAPRSGLVVKHSIDMAAGVVDPDYRGEVQVALANQGKLPFMVKTGDQIAQLLLKKADTPPSCEVDSLPATVWGEGSFRHTGVNAIAMGGMIDIPPIAERYAKLREVVPECYHNYLDIFNSDLCSSKLAPRRPRYDFEINLVPGSKLPPPARPYHLSREETKILDDWINGMLATRMISKCDIKTPLAAPVFFVRKKDGNKRPCINYR
jgi:dUTP pyrophosphatase